MSAACKYCRMQNLTWDFHNGGWHLMSGLEYHRCEEWRNQHPLATKKKKGKNTRRGAHLRWYGSRSARTYALLVEPYIDADTPVGVYHESPRSTAEQVRKAHGREA